MHMAGDRSTSVLLLSSDKLGLRRQLILTYSTRLNEAASEGRSGRENERERKAERGEEIVGGAALAFG